MKNKSQILLLIALMAMALAACQNSVESDPDNCIVELDELPLDGNAITGMEFNRISDEPFAGTQSASSMTFDNGILIFAKYGSSEVADTLLTADAAVDYLGDSATVLIDSPAVYGDKTIWAEIEDSFDSNAAVVRYGDYIMVADPRASADIAKGMVDAFDQALLNYISDNSVCAYLHPDSR